MRLEVPAALAPVRRVDDALRAAGGRPLVVGGTVRDHVFASMTGRPLPLDSDVDLEVAGLPLGRLESVLAGIGRVQTAGRSFGILRLEIQDGPLSIDIGIPRRDRKTGTGHRDFEVHLDPALSFTEAVRRRDFTINALGWDLSTGEVVDVVGGLSDLARRCLRAVDLRAFPEDPLRALRALHFAARFELAPDPETARACIASDVEALSPARVGSELDKLLLGADRPSLGLRLAAELGILERLLPTVARFLLFTATPSHGATTPAEHPRPGKTAMPGAPANPVGSDPAVPATDTGRGTAPRSRPTPGRPTAADATSAGAPSGGELPSWASASSVFGRTLAAVDRAAAATRGLDETVRRSVILATLTAPLIPAEGPPGPALGSPSDAGVPAMLTSVFERLSLGRHGPHDPRRLITALHREFPRLCRLEADRSQCTPSVLHRLSRTLPLAALAAFGRAMASFHGELGAPRQATPIPADPGAAVWDANAARWFAERIIGIEPWPRPLLEPGDLIAAGVPKATPIARILDELYALQLDGCVSTRQEALAAALDRVRH